MNTITSLRMIWILREKSIAVLAISEGLAMVLTRRVRTQTMTEMLSPDILMETDIRLNIKESNTPQESRM